MSHRGVSSSGVVPEVVKIFVTVGTELPFDRLVVAVDEWAARNGCADEVYAQIGESDVVPRHIGWVRFIEKPEFDRIFDQAEVIVSHAGMGTILSALDRQRRLLVMPRRASLGEHRNDHQLATTNRLVALDQVQVATDTDDLVRHLDDLATVSSGMQIGHYAEESLIAAIRSRIYASRL